MAVVLPLSGPETHPLSWRNVGAGGISPHHGVGSPYLHTAGCEPSSGWLKITTDLEYQNLVSNPALYDAKIFVDVIVDLLMF